MKLKKLIVSGFKSFADRTEFDFDDGISCIVGPNGCGKSNVVDAVKWVLGEQSAKSLRGSEMMDVIFNGSAVRRPANCAEVTLVFDNSSGLLKLESLDLAAAATIAVSRRLYRSGQSEYLINKAPSRLRDIREMFMDTGIGVDAYSVIEQGRVESFLQASQEDRRAMFDEAAGISKYKARKKEAMRKLERVDQNMLRVTDIIAEVEKRLRSIKYQAGKARNYQEYSERLKDLRSLYFQAQYHTMGLQRKGLQAALDAAGDALAALNARLEQLEAARNSVEAEAADLERSARDLGAKAGELAGQVSARQERAQLLEARAAELGEQLAAACAKCEQLEAKLARFDEECSVRKTELEQVEAQSTELAGRCQASRLEHLAQETLVTQLADKLEDEKTGAIDILRRTAQLHNEIQAHVIRRENLHGQRQRLTGRQAEIEKAMEGLLAERAGVEAKLADIQEVLRASQERFDQARQAGKQLDQNQQQAQEQLAALREQRSALQSRIETLQEMQLRREGVAESVRRILQARSDGALPDVVGMLGDFLRSDMEHAATVEAALVGADQSLLVAQYDKLEQSLAAINQALGDGGAIEVLCLDCLGPLVRDFDVASCPLIQARVLDWVSFEPSLSPLMWRLLGETFAVADLSAAFAAAQAAPAGSRFVTAAGEVLEPDGRVRIGAASRASGVIARRSELLDLQARQQELDRRIQQSQDRCASMKTQREHLEELQQKLRTAVYESSTERVECQSRLGQLNDQIGKIERERPLVAGDLKNLAVEIEQIVNREHQAKEKAEELAQVNEQRNAQVERLTLEIGAARARQGELSSQLTELKVALAQAEQKRLALRDAIASLTRQREQMDRDLSAGRADIELDRKRRQEALDGARSASEESQRLRAEKEKLDRELLEIEESRAGLARKLDDVRKELASHREAQETAQADMGKRRLALNEADMRIENLVTRASDEMQMNLVERFATYQHDDNRDWNAVEAEIADLRGKIERLGNVNLDAIAEQDELQQRQQFLDGQLQDVRATQGQLNELIARINKESRDLFLKTFEAVRANFQELFRKLFGGGRADMFLIDEQDVLESGIEVVARPPGKELRSISLLSGGEKTMTALALLFSIFRSRPSPFCILDEVDAALDEANNERFNRLVGEFVNTSQFLIISHAKRTMSMASVLYGVTMQEPGISRRISVRFEDAGNKLDEQLAPVGAA